MIDANLTYTLVGGEIGDSIGSGLGGEAALLYQIEEAPVRFGGGVAYSHLGIEEASGSAGKVSVFGSASVVLLTEDTDMAPYLQGRVGWTQFDISAEGADSKRSGLEISTVIGVDIPVAEKISVDVSGFFGWISGGDARLAEGTVPNSAKSGTAFALRGGVFYSFR